MVSPSSRMSSSTSTARPATMPGGATLHSMPRAARRRAVARGVDVVEVEREAQQRQDLAGEHHRAAHHRQHQRVCACERARISAASALHRRLHLRALATRSEFSRKAQACCTSGMPESSVFFR